MYLPVCLFVLYIYINVARGDSERASHPGAEKREGHPGVDHREAGKQTGGHEGPLQGLEGRRRGDGEKTQPETEKMNFKKRISYI